METTSVSINREMEKEDVVHIYSGILLSHEKNKIMPSAAIWMDPEMITLSEVSQRKTYITWHFLYVESKKEKKSTNELIYKTEIKLEI